MSRLPIATVACVAALDGWFGSLPRALAQCYDLYTVSNTNELMSINLPGCTATAIGITQDPSGGPVRLIRGLAYDAGADILYGMTREGDLVTVNRTTGGTSFLLSVATLGTGMQFWSGLAFDAVNNDLYTTNAFGGHELVKIDLPGLVPSLQGSTLWIVDGSPRQILGLDFKGGVLYGSNRDNDNIVDVNPTTGAVTMTWGNQTAGVPNQQEIASHPGTGVLYAIHDHFSSSNNAALSTFNTSYQSTELCELPFGIVETVVGGNDTYGWGGLAFAEACPPLVPSCPPPCSAVPFNKLYKFKCPPPITGCPNNVAGAWCLGELCCFEAKDFSVPGATTMLDLVNNFRDSVNNQGCPVNKLFATVVNVTPPEGHVRIEGYKCGGPASPLVFRVGTGGAVSCSTLNVVALGGNVTIPGQYNPDVYEIPLSGDDCNGNGEDDLIDILAGTSLDANVNGIPDECEQRGACCDNDPFGPCIDDVTQTECDCEKCKWFEKQTCAQIECLHNPIPAVSEWGLVVLTLLLLIGAKIYFARRRTATAS